MYPSHGVPMKASTDGRSKKFAVAIAQSQRAKCVRRPNNPSIVIDVRGLGDKNSSTLSKTIRNGTSFQQRSISIEEELRTKIPGTPVGTIWNSIRARSRIFLHSNEFVKLGLINGPEDVVRSGRFCFPFPILHINLSATIHFGQTTCCVRGCSATSPSRKDKLDSARITAHCNPRPPHLCPWP